MRIDTINLTSVQINTIEDVQKLKDVLTIDDRSFIQIEDLKILSNCDCFKYTYKSSDVNVIDLCDVLTHILSNIDLLQRISTEIHSIHYYKMIMTKKRIENIYKFISILNAASQLELTDDDINDLDDAMILTKHVRFEKGTNIIKLSSYFKNDSSFWSYISPLFRINIDTNVITRHSLLIKCIYISNPNFFKQLNKDLKIKRLNMV